MSYTTRITDWGGTPSKPTAEEIIAAIRFFDHNTTHYYGDVLAAAYMEAIEALRGCSEAIDYFNKNGRTDFPLAKRLTALSKLLKAAEEAEAVVLAKAPKEDESVDS